ncbi:hypothetical protein MTR67_021754 [Solanum verrucosum]|uniref:Protein kinase domain-containing protein n=1 Tax=Solanum verrucosum TaxID=315347 RepID=A0AAF0QYP1_SOLVR|nr:hypothetical protein MTR67_021754 [Solanum verrucosum]
MQYRHQIETALQNGVISGLGLNSSSITLTRNRVHRLSVRIKKVDSIQEVVGKGSYGVVASAVDTHTGKKVAIKKINNVFEHVSEATRILREIKLLRLLRHPDIVEIKHILLPPCPREFKDIYVVC